VWIGVVGVAGGGVSILLGPEGTSPRVGLVVLGFPVAWPALVGVGVVGLLVENCTVDASIFVVKFLRANGGCLGTRSR
jgi:uncharacterized membrane protein YadS